MVFDKIICICRRGDLAFKKINWDRLHVVYKEKAANAKGDDIFFVLMDILAELKDGHVTLNSRGGGIPTIPYEPPRMIRDRSLYRSENVRTILNLKLTGENHIEYGLTYDNIGYVYIGTFTDGTWAYAIDNVLQELKGAKGLVVDVRNNGGGTSLSSDVIVGCFIKTSLASPPVYLHGVKQPAIYCLPRGQFQWTKKNVVLINGASFSAAEYFPLMMKQQPFVTTIGDTTGGGGGSYEFFRLPSGTRLRMPVKEYRTYDGVEIEWNGVAPDILVEQNADHLLQGRDDQLEYALQYLR